MLDAAMRSSDPQNYLDGVHTAFDDAGRSDDALAAMVLRALIRSHEIEMLMHIRAEWSGQRTLARPRSTKPT